MGRLIFARLAFAILALVTLAAWLAVLPGCGVDDSGLSNALARGQTDADAGVVTPTLPDGGKTADLVSSSPTIDAFADESTLNEDGGSGHGPDTSESTDVIRDSGGEPNPVSDAGNSPPECPLEPTRSLSSCSGAQIYALCRYTLDGHPALQVGCTAEGYLCVKMCP